VKKIVIISSAVLALVIGIAIPAFAQQEEKGDKQDQPKQQQKAKEQAKPEEQHGQQQQNPDKHQSQDKQQQQQQDQNKQQHAQQQQNQDKQQHAQQNQSKQQHAQQQEQHTQQQQNEYKRQHQDQNNQQQHAQQQYPQHTPAQHRDEQRAWQDRRATSWQSDHRSWQQRGGYDGYRIPEDRYRGYFGPQHWFRIYDRPFVVYGGYPRFQYGGYWVTLLDPWPEYWANDWYDNDDVYVDYGNDGYYMYNRRYPGVGIAISISM